MCLAVTSARPARRSPTGLHEHVRPDTQSPYPHLWLPDERLRFRKDGGRAGRGRLCAGRFARSGRPGPAQHLPHPRKGGGEGLFRDRPAPRAQDERRGGRPVGDDRRRRLRRPGRGRGDHARARRRSTSSSGRSPIIGCRTSSREAERGAGSSPPISRSRRSSACSTGSSARPRRTRRRGRRYAAFLTVQEGCDKFCTFCVVPYTRGAEVSRPVAAIVAEASRLAAEGVREITLLGQNVNAWRGRRSRRAATGASAGCSSGSPKSRASTGCATRPATPATWTTTLIAAHRDLDALMPYLHLPVQSGSDRILAAMNRRHTPGRLSRAPSTGSARRGRTSRFPATSSSASPARPRQTSTTRSAIVDEVGYASAFSFKYSPRPGTPAATMDQVPEPVKAERLARLQAAINATQARFNRVAGRHDVPSAVRADGPPARARSSAARPGSRRSRSMATPELIGSIRPVDDHRDGHQQPVRHAWPVGVPRRGRRWRRPRLERASARRGAVCAALADRTRRTSSSPSTTTGCAGAFRRVRPEPRA